MSFLLVLHNFLVEFVDDLLSWQLYAPWCHHCQELEPTYNRLAKRLMGIPSLSIVKMNMEANEHPLAKVTLTVFIFSSEQKFYESMFGPIENCSNTSCYQRESTNPWFVFSFSVGRRLSDHPVLLCWK